jgi:hypothetical protein
MSNDKKRPSAEADTRPQSHKKRRIGRPHTRFEKLVSISTRCPDSVLTYVKKLYPSLYHSMTAMFEDVLTRFIKERPWDHGLLWRQPKGVLRYIDGEPMRTGWSLLNIQLPPNLAEQVKHLSLTSRVSVASLCYTAIFWWIKYIYPPK